MPSENQKSIVAYCSPAGTTEHVAKVIARKLESLGVDVMVLTLGRPFDLSPIFSEIEAGREHLSLYVGSPVYASHALPPVMDFILHLPESHKASAVPFVTWGAVTSGIALYEMGKALVEKGYNLAGAAKVLAVHSIMWHWETPYANGHPDSGDDGKIEELVSEVTGRIRRRSVKSMPLSKLAYHPPDILRAMEKRTFEKAKPDFPKRQINEALCTQCGICSDVCPVDAITYSPRPAFSPHCIFCYNCIRHCPEGAIEGDFTPVKEHVKRRLRQVGEKAETEIFL